MACWNVISHQEASSGSVGSFDFTSIPSSYDHLCLRLSLRDDKSSAYKNNIHLELNGSTSSEYSTTMLYCGSTVLSTRASASYDFYSAYEACEDTLADTFATAEIWFIDYSNTDTYKTYVSQGGLPNNDSTEWRWQNFVTGGSFQSTAAINRIYFEPDGSFYDYVQYSSATLYGINGAA